MSYPLPVTFSISPLTPGLDYTPQEFANAIASRLSIDSQNQLTFFVAGATAPSSNNGPWLKNNITWYVWSNTLGQYVPQIIEFESLRYIAQTTGPDHNKYVFWIQIDSNGKAQSIQYFYNGAWHDIYEDKFATYSNTTAMNAAIALATKTYPASAVLTGSQSVNIDGTLHKVLFNQALINPDANYDSANSRYICPLGGVYSVASNLQIDNAGGTSAAMEIGIRIVVNGAVSAPGIPTSGTAVASPPGDRWYPQASGLLSLNAGDYIEVYVSAEDGVDASNISIAPQSQFFINLVQRL